VAIRDELAAFNQAFSEAHAAQDFDRIANLYSDEAVFVSSGQPLVRGRHAIASMLLEPPESGMVPITFETGDVWESGNLVVDVGSYVVSGDQEHRGKYVVVYQRQADGSLRLLVDSPTSDP
jgi:ketosteroid isomerase-like protein